MRRRWEDLGEKGGKEKGQTELFLIYLCLSAF
jgi:hypothetical protein